MRKIYVRLSDKSEAFIQAKAAELQKTESEVINQMIENRAKAEKIIKVKKKPDKQPTFSAD